MLKIKTLLIGVVAIIAAFAVGLFFTLFLADFNYFYLLAAIIFGLFWLAVFTVKNILIKDSGIAFIFIFLEILALFLPSFLKFNPAWLTLVGLLGFISLSGAYLIGRQQINKHLKISFAELRQHMLPLASAALVVMLVAVYFVSLEDRPLSVSQQTISLISQPLTPLVNQIFPGFSPEKPLGDFFESLSLQIYGEQINPQLFASQLKDSINQTVGVALALNESVVESISKIVNKLLEQSSGGLRVATITSLIALLLILVSGATFFINIIAALLAWIIYKLILAAGFAYTSFKEVKQEVVEF